MSDRLLTMHEVRRFIPLARSTILAMIGRGDFPQPKRVGKRTLWRESDIQAFIANLPE